MKKGFQQTPHSALAERLKNAWKSNDGQFIARLVKLLEKVDKKLPDGSIGNKLEMIKIIADNKYKFLDFK